MDIVIDEVATKDQQKSLDGNLISERLTNTDLNKSNSVINIV